MGRAGPADRYGDDELVAAIRQIGEAVEDPTALTQKQFDELREQMGVRCPRAAAICSRVGVSWAKVKESAFGDPADAFHHFRRTSEGNPRFVATRQVCVAAVRLAARRISSPTLLPHEYERQREIALRRVRGANRLRAEARWPPVSRIKAFGWNEIASEAGLAIRPEPQRPKSMAVVDVMELFLECRGYVPRRTKIREFANGHGISMTRDKGETSAYLDVLRERRDASGVWTPRLIYGGPVEIPPEAQAYEAERVAAFAEAYPVVQKGTWTEERILGGIDRAVSKLRAGESLTQKRLRELSKENRGTIPSPTTVTEYASKHGTSLPELREQAIRRANAGYLKGKQQP